MDIRDWGKEEFYSGSDCQRMVDIIGNVNKPDSSSSCLTSAYSLRTLHKKK